MLVVLKFGGTSLKDQTGFHHAYQHVLKEKNNGAKVICVVSAMGREQDDYSTDRLKSLIENYVSKPEQDRLISVGETISSVVFTDFLIKQGIRAISLATKEIGIVTDEEFTNANIIAFNPEYIELMLEQYECIVVPGFQGMTKDGRITTLGRGGSDTTAIYLGIMLKADKIKIVSDVDGIYSGDPRIIKNAIHYPVISYKQLVNITANGSKVLHVKAARMAMQHKAPVIFCHNNHSANYTILSDNAPPIFNVTIKANYNCYQLKTPISVESIISYLENYYLEENECKAFETHLEQHKIPFIKSSGYYKISLLSGDDANLSNKCAFVDQSAYIDQINLLHDCYLYRGMTYGSKNPR